MDSISRSVREGKAQLAQSLASIFERLEMDADRFEQRLTNMLKTNRFYGSFCSASREALRHVAAKLGVKQLANTA